MPQKIRVQPFTFMFVVWVSIYGLAVYAGNIDHFSTNTLSPNDYLSGANGALGDPVFDKYRTISLDVDIGIGSDCGRINITNTLRAALKNILDSKYLENMLGWTELWDRIVSAAKIVGVYHDKCQ